MMPDATATAIATATSSSSSLPDEEGTSSSSREKENIMPSNIINSPLKPKQDYDDGQDPEDNDTEKQKEDKTMGNKGIINTNQEQETKKKKKMKSVSFSPNGLCRRTLHIKNYSKSERKRCWYTSKEMKLNKNEIQHTVQMLETNQEPIIDEITLSRRGVEQYTSSQWKLRTARRKYAQRVVFKKQMDLFVESTNGEFEEDYIYSDDDAMKIALVYHQAVRESVASSYMRGVSMRSEELCDEEGIYKIHDWSTSSTSEDYNSDEEKGPNKNHQPTSNAVVLNMNTMQTTLQKEGRIQMRRNSIINSAA